MSKLMRKIMAFTLGVIFGVVAIAGSLIGGAYWAYKNVKPVDLVTKNKPVDGELGELEAASIENLLDLLAEAMENPSEYTIARLEKEYGFDAESFLKKAGVITDDPRNVDMDALRGVSLFTLFAKGGGFNAFLDGIKLRALYVFLPKITGKPLDEFLSVEAREKLGDYSILELVKDTNGDGEIGAVTALKNLKLGAMLPSLFEAEYDPLAHEYIYTLKDQEKLPILDVFSNVYVGTVFDIANGSDIYYELMEGGLKSISEMYLSDIVVLLGKTVSGGSSSGVENLAAGGAFNYEERARAFGDLKVKDLFVKKDGKYVFSSDALLSELEVGYILGYDKGEDGLWYNAKGERVDGVFEALANADIAEVLDNKGDVKKMLLSVFRDVNLKDLLDLANAKNAPQALEKLYGVTVGEILDGESEDATENFLNAVSEALGDATLGEVLGKTTDNPLLEGVYNIQIGKLCKKNLDRDTVIEVMQSAIGAVSVGDMLGLTKDEKGEWSTDDPLLLLLANFSFNNIFNLMKAGEDSEAIAKALLGDITVGDIFAVSYGYKYDDYSDNWYRDTEYDDGSVTTEWLDPNFGKVLKIKLWQMLESSDPMSTYELYPDVKHLTVGEIVYSFMQATRSLPKGLVHVDSTEFEYIERAQGGYAYADPDLRQLSEILLQIDVEEIRLHSQDREYWKEKLRPVESKAVLGLFLTEEQENRNAFVKAALGVTFGDLLDLMDDRSDKAISDFITKRFTYADINGERVVIYVGDVMKLYKSDYANNSALKVIGEIEFAPFMRALLGTQSKREVFGHIKLKDLVYDYLPDGRIKNSDFVLRTLELTLGEIIDLKNGSLSATFHALEPHYDGLTLENSIDDFWTGYPKHAAVVEFLSLEVDDVMHALHTRQFKPIADKIKECYDVLNKQEKLVFLGVSGVFAGALYVFDDPLLVKLAGQMVGDKVWGDYFAKPLGFVLEDGSWTLEGVYNDLADRLLKEKIVDTLDRTKVSIKDEYVKVADLGNLFVSHQKLVQTTNKLAEKLHLGRLASDETGIFLDGVYAGLSRIVFDIVPYEVYQNRNDLPKYIKDKFGAIMLGDIAAPVARKVLGKVGFDYSYALTDGEYDVSGSFVNLSEVAYNITLNDLYDVLRNPKLIKKYVAVLNFGDLAADLSNFVADKIPSAGYKGHSELSEDETSWTVEGDGKIFLNIIYNLNIREAFNGLKSEGKAYLLTLFGDIKVGDVVAPAAVKVVKSLKFDYYCGMDSDGRYEVDGAFVNLSEVAFNLTFRDIYDVYKTPAEIKNYIGMFNVGDLMADLSNFASDHFKSALYRGHSELNLDKASWTVEGNYKFILGILYNTNLRELLSGIVNKGRSYVAEQFGDIRVGHLFAKGTLQFNERTETWLKPNGEPYDFDSQLDSVVRRRLYNLSVREVLSGDFEYTDLISDIYLAELIGYKCADSDNPTHKHNDDCVWYEEREVIVAGEEALGPQTRLVKVTGANSVIAGISGQQILDSGLTVAYLFDKNKIGEVMGLKRGEVIEDLGDETYNYEWYYYYENEQGYNVVDANGELMGRAQPVPVLVRTIANIEAKMLTRQDAADIIINEIYDLRLGYVLEYTYDLTNPARPVWRYPDGRAVPGLMQKLSSYTIEQISTDIDSITDTWTLSDLLEDETELENDRILWLLKDTPLRQVTSAINNIRVGEAMGYYEGPDGLWYSDEACTQLVTDEILLVLCDYKIGHLTGNIELDAHGTSFADDVVDSILQNVSVGTFFKNDYADNAFTSLLDPTWKLGELTSRFDEALKDASIGKLIDLGILGDTFNEETEEGRENVALMDSVFSGAEWRDYTMPQFMNELLITLKSYKDVLDNYGLLG